jgi:hypothetical protein
MVVMVVVCMRMGGMPRGGCLAGHPGRRGSDVEDLRREIQGIKDEIQKLRETT